MELTVSTTDGVVVVVNVVKEVGTAVLRTGVTILKSGLGFFSNLLYSALSSDEDDEDDDDEEEEEEEEEEKKKGSDGGDAAAAVSEEVAVPRAAKLDVVKLVNALLKLTSEAEKVKLAQAISSVLERVEVVEINSLKTTSLMLNACYDFHQVLAPGWYVSPYVCAGGGGSIVSFGRGHFDLRPAYRVKFGVNYSFSETFSMFAGGVYHRILGKKYDNIPVRRMEDDLTFPGRTKESASASFKLRYWGIEVGVRYAF